MSGVCRLTGRVLRRASKGVYGGYLNHGLSGAVRNAGGVRETSGIYTRLSVGLSSISYMVYGGVFGGLGRSVCRGVSSGVGRLKVRFSAFLMNSGLPGSVRRHSRRLSSGFSLAIRAVGGRVGELVNLKL